MAYVKILNIKSASHVGNSVDYVENDEKTNAASRVKMIKEEEGIGVGEENSDIDSAISGLVEYTTRDSATEEKHLVTGINCTTHNAATEMRDLAEFWKRERRIEGVSRDAFHIIQSFDPKDNPNMTPEMVHEIGKKYCEALSHMDDKHEVNRRYMMLLSTHVDKEHLHNHIILCSYDMDTGRKFHECRDVYRQMKEASDRLCKEYNLSVIEDPDNDRKNSRYEWNKAKSGTSWKDNVRKDIDAMKSISSNWDEFRTYMTSVGYDMREGKYVTYTTLDNHKIRDKSLGREWTKAEIEKSWERERPHERGEDEAKEQIKRFYKDNPEGQKKAEKTFIGLGWLDDVGGRRSVLATMLMIAMEMMKEDEAFKGNVYFSDMKQLPTPEKEREYRIRRLDNALDIAKREGIGSQEELTARLDKCGSAMSHARKELSRNKSLLNKMEVISHSLEEMEAVKDVVDKINSYSEGPIKKDFQKQHASELEQYKKAMSVLYRYKCTTPGQIEDFRIRYDKVKQNIVEYTSQVNELRCEYKTLMKIQNGLNLAQNQGYLSGGFYEDPEKEPEKDEETKPEKEAGKRERDAVR